MGERRRDLRRGSVQQLALEAAKARLTAFAAWFDHWFNLIQALAARIFFTLHAVACIGFAALCFDTKWWLLCITLVGMLVETILIVFKTESRSWKWFCPCVLCYLIAAVPPIWIARLELYNNPEVTCKLFESAQRNRINQIEETLVDMNWTLPDGMGGFEFGSSNRSEITSFADILRESQLKAQETISQITISEITELSELMQGSFGDLASKFERGLDGVPMKDQISILEATLMFVLIIGRWMLPKGSLTRDQLSLLLLVYIGMAADIVELFDMFQIERIASNKRILVITLSVWSWSLLQFSLVKTVNKKRKSQKKKKKQKKSSARPTDQPILQKPGGHNQLLGVIKEDSNEASQVPDITLAVLAVQKKKGCCAQLKGWCRWVIERGVWSLVATLIMQDIPFLALRMTIMVHFEVVNQPIVFFTVKNLLVILMQLYRLAVLFLTRNKEEESRGMETLTNELVAMIRSRSRGGHAASVDTAAM